MLICLYKNPRLVGKTLVWGKIKWRNGSSWGKIRCRKLKRNKFQNFYFKCPYAVLFLPSTSKYFWGLSWNSQNALTTPRGCHFSPGTVYLDPETNTENLLHNFFAIVFVMQCISTKPMQVNMHSWLQSFPMGVRLSHCFQRAILSLFSIHPIFGWWSHPVRPT